ncbi:acetyltransferase, GNAT family [Paenibacillus algicola]|uniref:Acetyltransferase, GNAT family n=1 Tax=Paenibacillus algicola TaxID=2565926 RepID=A0A4P8XQG1_9BACL|nr:GNAT family N-acetyltransferase [Paenibacillus algicola]QCT04763.1 acetyltransferase, GNAT family [Paenibacillus algicola]
MPTPFKAYAFQGRIPGDYRQLLLPEHYAYLQQLPAECFAIGIACGEKPAALAVLYRDPGSPEGKLQSFVVAPAWRRRGLGRQLYTLLENWAQQQQLKQIHVEYLAPAAAQLEESKAKPAAGLQDTVSVPARFLQACGFHIPQPGIYVWKGSLKELVQEPRGNRLQLTSSFSVTPFYELSDIERASIKNRVELPYPSILDPFIEEHVIDQEHSLILRQNGNIAGWITVERFNNNTVLLKTMYVKDSCRSKGWGLVLALEACRLLEREGLYENWIGFVEASNPLMARLAIKQLSPLHSVSVEVLWRTSKSI